MDSYFVTGIGTGIGKTVLSAVLLRLCSGVYWKPVQSGDLDDTDSDKVQRWSGLPGSHIAQEAYRLQAALSPHASAALEGASIDMDVILSARPSAQPIVVEGAGGLFVPLNDVYCMIDLVGRLGLPVVLLSRHYLGSINHTLLSLEALHYRGLPVRGIVFAGKPNISSEQAILSRTDVPLLGHLPEMDHIDLSAIDEMVTLAHDEWYW